MKLNEEEILGINTQLDLSIAESISQNLIREKAMKNGVKLIDPSSTFINHDTKFGKDVIVHPNVVFGNNVIIDSFVEIKSFTHIEECKIREGAVIGPFARIRGGTVVGKKYESWKFCRNQKK